MTKTFPVIDLTATGENILRLRKARGLTVRDLQSWFGFEDPQAIYKWQKGKSLPTVDNLYALGALLEVPIEEILVPRKPKLNIVNNGQQDHPCCPSVLPDCFEYGRTVRPCRLLRGVIGTLGPLRNRLKINSKDIFPTWRRFYERGRNGEITKSVLAIGWQALSIGG